MVQEQITVALQKSLVTRRKMTHALAMSSQKTSKPFQQGTSNTIMGQFQQKPFMRPRIKHPGQVHEQAVRAMMCLSPQ